MGGSRLSATVVRVLLVAVAAGAAIVTHAIDTRLDRFDVHELSATEMAETLRWLDGFYSSAEGLQRPGGLVVNGTVDYEAISNWLFRNYLQARADGATPEEARKGIAEAIEASPEWRSKHP